MQSVSSVHDGSLFTGASSQPSSSTSSSSSLFADCFETASDALGSSSSVSGSSSSQSDDSGLLAFMAYAKETPEERMFDSFLNSQGITMDEYKQMTPQQQQALMTKFETEEKQKIDQELGVNAGPSNLASGQLQTAASI